MTKEPANRSQVVELLLRRAEREEKKQQQLYKKTNSLKNVQPCLLHLRGVGDRSPRVSRYGLSVNSMHAGGDGDVCLNLKGDEGPRSSSVRLL